MWVAVGDGLADRAVLCHADEVDTPCVYADAAYLHVLLLGGFQSLDNLKIEGVDVPVEVSVDLYKIVVEAGEFLQFYLAVVETAKYGATAGSTEVHRKEIVLLFH